MPDHARRVYESVLELLSSVDNPTPLVRLRRVLPHRHAVVYAKLEWYNPFGASKDRVAANLVLDAERRGVLAPDSALVEPTSGNTGIGLAMIANAKGYRLTATMSAAVPAEKRTALRLFGCEVREVDDDLCPAPGAPEGAIALAVELARHSGSHHLDQYKNPANPDAHYRTTGPEIWRQTEGRITHFVAGLGTCGTITGTGRFLKEKRREIQVVGVHPSEGHDIPGVRSLRQLRHTELFFPDEYDGLVEIDDARAFALCGRLNQEESLVAGPSSGLALAGALERIPDEPGVVGVVIFPDSAWKYTSSVQRHLPALFGGAGSPVSAASGHAAGLHEAALRLARTSPDVIDVGEAERLSESGRAVWVDVRSPEEFRDERVAESLNVPLDELASGSTRGLPSGRDTPLVTVCNVGEKSLVGMMLLKALGYSNVKSLLGGLRAWTAEGMLTESGS